MTTHADPIILLADPAVGSVPVHECAEPLVPLDPRLGAGVLLRTGVAARVEHAASRLPCGFGLRVQEGYRPASAQQAIIDMYAAQVAAAHPGADAAEQRRLTSRFVAPLAVAPHVAGAAVDVTVTGFDGQDLDLGTPIDATPESSGGRCFTQAMDIGDRPRLLRQLLADVMTAAGLVNYPTEWWHWSYGDRYWALRTGSAYALYGPCPEPTLASAVRYAS